MHPITLIEVLSFVIDGILMLTGYLVKHRSSQFPDMTCGYHVGKLASKSEEAWQEANRYFGTLLIRSAWALFAVSIFVVIALFVFNHGEITGDLMLFWVLFCYLMLSALVPVFGTIAATESHLKKLFGTDGVKK